MVNSEQNTKRDSEEDGRPTVLIVEDEALIAAYLADLLDDSGFKIAGIAATGARALSLASTLTVDIALIDISLEGTMDGIDLGIELAQHHTAKIFFLSGALDPDKQDRAAAANPSGFLAKPFTSRQLLQTLEPFRRASGGQ